jgi:hypothetical protein
MRERKRGVGSKMFACEHSVKKASKPAMMPLKAHPLAPALFRGFKAQAATSSSRRHGTPESARPSVHPCVAVNAARTPP